MTDPRGFIRRVWAALDEEERKRQNRNWIERNGTPPPWTAAGRQHAADAELHESLKRNPPAVQGDARWMTSAEAKKIAEPVNGKMWAEDGSFVFGEAIDMATRTGCEIAAARPPGHALTIAATRAGKGTAQIIPQILLHRGSMLIIDPKGENYIATQKRRRDVGRVIRIDPFRVTERGDPDAAFAAYNPLRAVKDASEARRLTRLLIGEPPDRGDPFWNKRAESLLQAVIYHVCQTANPTFAKVRDILVTPDDDVSIEAYHNGGKSELQRKLLQISEESDTTFVKNALTEFTGFSHKVRTGIIATLSADLSIWDEPEISETISDHHFDFDELKRGRVTIYVILPFDKLHTYGGFLRIFIGQFYQAMIHEPTIPDVPVMCLIDEFPALGPMDEIVKCLSEIGGYGVRFWLFAQGLSQLKRVYPDHWGEILSQCAAKSFFGVTDIETAKWLSESLGKMTVGIETPTIGFSGGGPDAQGYASVGASSGRSVQLHGKPLLSEAEIQEGLGVGTMVQIVQLSGHRPMLGLLVPWYDDTEMVEFVTDPQRLVIEQGRPALAAPNTSTQWGFRPTGREKDE